jgi:hypothetical protein
MLVVSSNRLKFFYTQVTHPIEVVSYVVDAFSREKKWLLTAVSSIWNILLWHINGPLDLVTKEGYCIEQDRCFVRESCRYEIDVAT